MGFNTGFNLDDIGRFDQALTDEDAFGVTTGISTVGQQGGTISITLDNPEDSGWTAVVTSTRVSSNFSADVRVYDGFSQAPSGGTALTIDNLLLDSDNDATEGRMTARQGDTFTETNTQDSLILGGGGGGNAVGAVGSTTKFALEPGRTVVVEVTNDTNNEGEGTLSMFYYERNGTFSGD